MINCKTFVNLKGRRGPQLLSYNASRFIFYFVNRTLEEQVLSVYTELKVIVNTEFRESFCFHKICHIVKQGVSLNFGIRT
jgi:hypothetical protein